MHIVIIEESHNRVVWEVKTPLLSIEVGALIGLLVFVGVLFLTMSGLRWGLIGGVTTVVLSVAVYLALRMPISERGMLERRPYGSGDRGETRREQHWLLRGKQVAWVLPLEKVMGFWLETQRFEGLSEYPYTMARLWTVAYEEELEPVTHWGDVQEVQDLGMALAKVARRRFDIS